MSEFYTTDMYRDLIRHSWLGFIRSATLSRNVATLIFIGLLSLMFGGYFIALAFFLDKILQAVSGQKDTFSFLNELLIYYFFLDALLRYFMQSLPVLKIQPYLHLPLGRSRLLHYLLVRSYLHPFNWLSALFFAPYAFHTLAPQIGMGAATQWWTAMVLLTLIINGLLFFFKKHLDDKAIGTVILIVLLGGAALSQYFGWFSFGELTAPFFEQAAYQLWIPLLLAGLLIAVYVLNFRFLYSRIYPEDWAANKQERMRAVPALGFLQSLGSTGELIGLQWRLILRHKRSRSVLMLSAFFLLYGLIFYPNPVYTTEMPSFLLFVGVFVTGIFMINFGQLLYGWDSSNFDFYLTKPLGMEQYIRSKYYLLGGVTVLCYVLTIPYLYFGWDILLINTATALFNLGVNVFIIMNMAMWEPKRLNLSNGSMFNYEGLGAAQWIMGLPIIFLPYAVYLPFSWIGMPKVGLLILGILGLLGVLLHKRLIRATAYRLQARKYPIAHTFRNE